jgi:RNA-directed DNA polymerase
MDLEKFFDRVNHDKLMSEVAKRVKDGRLLALIRRFLTAGVLDHDALHETVEGTPQGGLCKALHNERMQPDKQPRGGYLEVSFVVHWPRGCLPLMRGVGGRRLRSRSPFIALRV